MEEHEVDFAIGSVISTVFADIALWVALCRRSGMDEPTAIRVAHSIVEQQYWLN